MIDIDLLNRTKLYPTQIDRWKETKTETDHEIINDSKLQTKSFDLSLEYYNMHVWMEDLFMTIHLSCICLFRIPAKMLQISNPKTCKLFRLVAMLLHIETSSRLFARYTDTPKHKHSKNALENWLTNNGVEVREGMGRQEKIITSK